MKLINDNIIEDLSDSLGLKFLPEGKREEVLTEIAKLISRKAGARIMDDFDSGEVEEFNKIPKDDLEQMENFLISKNPNAKNIFKEEARKIKEEMLGIKI